MEIRVSVPCTKFLGSVYTVCIAYMIARDIAQIAGQLGGSSFAYGVDRN